MRRRLTAGKSSLTGRVSTAGGEPLICFSRQTARQHSAEGNLPRTSFLGGIFFRPKPRPGFFLSSSLPDKSRTLSAEGTKSCAVTCPAIRLWPSLAVAKAIPRASGSGKNPASCFNGKVIWIFFHFNMAVGGGLFCEPRKTMTPSRYIYEQFWFLFPAIKRIGTVPAGGDDSKRRYGGTP